MNAAPTAALTPRIADDKEFFRVSLYCENRGSATSWGKSHPFTAESPDGLTRRVGAFLFFEANTGNISSSNLRSSGANLLTLRIREQNFRIREQDFPHRPELHI